MIRNDKRNISSDDPGMNRKKNEKICNNALRISVQFYVICFG